MAGNSSAGREFFGRLMAGEFFGLENQFFLHVLATGPRPVYPLRRIFPD